MPQPLIDSPVGIPGMLCAAGSATSWRVGIRGTSPRPAAYIGVSPSGAVIAPFHRPSLVADSGSMAGFGYAIGNCLALPTGWSPRMAVGQ